MSYQPTRDLSREAVSEPWRLTREWWAAYNHEDVETKRALARFPLVTFGGAELGPTALNERVFHDPSDLTARGRDPGWSHSVVDRWAVHQPTPRKAHVVLDFRRCRANGAPYGVGHSRLTVFTKEDEEWRARVLSSCGLRHPDDVGALTDRDREEAVRQTVEALLAAAAEGDEATLRDRCHVPFVRLDGPSFDLAESAAAIEFDLGDPDVETDLLACEVLPPQSTDKVLVDLTLRRTAADGTDLTPAGGLSLLTKRDGDWGLQMSSTRGVGGLP